MSPNVAIQLSHWLGHLCRLEEVKQLKVHFLGGEPFENFDGLLQLIDQLEISIPTTTMSHSDGRYVVFTNGDFITYPNLSELHKRHVRIMLNPTTKPLSRVEDKMEKIKLYCGGVSLAVVADR